MAERKKISVIGAGAVGATTAHWIASKELADVCLVDIEEGMPQGKGLDLSQAGPIEGFDCRIVGSNDYAQTQFSDVVILTAGLPRKPGMSRDDLLAKNKEIVSSVTREIVRYSPETIIIVISNPLDAMVYVTYKASGLPAHRVMGMAGILDSARFRTFIAQELNVSVEDVNACVLGGHGDAMVPLPRMSSVSGIPLTELLSAERIDSLVERTRYGGGEIVKLLKTGSAFFAPSSAAVQMAECIIKDKKRILPCAAYCDQEYGVGGYFVGVPVKLGAKGVEEIVELDLRSDEWKDFNRSVQGVKELISEIEI